MSLLFIYYLTFAVMLSLGSFVVIKEKQRKALRVMKANEHPVVRPKP